MNLQLEKECCRYVCIIESSHIFNYLLINVFVQLKIKLFFFALPVIRPIYVGIYFNVDMLVMGHIKLII